MSTTELVDYMLKMVKPNLEVLNEQTSTTNLNKSEGKVLFSDRNNEHELNAMMNVVFVEKMAAAARRRYENQVSISYFIVNF